MPMFCSKIAQEEHDKLKSTFLTLLDCFYLDHNNNLVWSYQEGISVEDVCGEETEQYCINLIKANKGEL